MTKKIIKKEQLSQPKDFIEFLKADFNIKQKKSRPKSTGTIKQINNEQTDFSELSVNKAESRDARVIKKSSEKISISNTIPRHMKRDSRLLSAAAKLLPDEKSKIASDDIDEERVKDWMDAVNNIGQELLLPLPVKSVRSLVKKTITEPAVIYPVAHNVKDRTLHIQKKTAQTLSRNPWGVQLVSLCIIALIASYYIAKLAPAEADQIIAISDKIVLGPFEKVQSLKYSNITASKEMLAQFIVANKNKYKPDLSGKSDSYTIHASELFGQSAEAEELVDPSGALIEKKKASLTVKADSILSNTAQSIKNFYQEVYNIQQNISNNWKNKLNDQIEK